MCGLDAAITAWGFFFSWPMFSERPVAWIVPLWSLLRMFSLGHAHSLPNSFNFYVKAWLPRHCLCMRVAYCSASVWSEVLLKALVPMRLPHCAEFLCRLESVSKTAHILLWLLLSRWSLMLVYRLPDTHGWLWSLENFSWLSLPLVFSIKLLVALPFCLLLLVSWSYECLLNLSQPKSPLFSTTPLAWNFPPSPPNKISPPQTELGALSPYSLTLPWRESLHHRTGSRLRDSNPLILKWTCLL